LGWLDGVTATSSFVLGRTNLFMTNFEDKCLQLEKKVFLPIGRRRGDNYLLGLISAAYYIGFWHVDTVLCSTVYSLFGAQLVFKMG